MLREMGMAFWLPEAEREPAEASTQSDPMTLEQAVAYALEEPPSTWG